MNDEFYEQYHQKGGTYDIPVEVFNELLEENEELKKQLEDMTDCRDIASGHRKEVQDRETILLKQQQKFINWLEDKINHFKDLEQFAIKVFNNKAVINLDLVKRSMEEDNLLISNFEEILQKYKEIIGVEDEKENE